MNSSWVVVDVRHKLPGTKTPKIRCLKSSKLKPPIPRDKEVQSQQDDSNPKLFLTFVNGFFSLGNIRWSYCESEMRKGCSSMRQLLDSAQFRRVCCLAMCVPSRGQSVLRPGHPPSPPVVPSSTNTHNSLSPLPIWFYPPKGQLG